MASVYRYLIVAALLLIHCAECGQINSISRVQQTQNGVSKWVQLLDMSCDSVDTSPLFFALTRLNQATSNTFEIICPPPAYVYAATIRETVPLYSQSVQIPIIQTQRTVNYSSEIVGTSERIATEQLEIARRSTENTDIQTVLSIMSRLPNLRPNDKAYWTLQGMSRNLQKSNPLAFYTVQKYMHAVNEWKLSGKDRSQFPTFINESHVIYPRPVQHLLRLSNWQRAGLYQAQQTANNQSLRDSTFYLMGEGDIGNNETFGPGIIPPPPKGKFQEGDFGEASTPEVPQLRDAIIGSSVALHVVRGISTALGASILKNGLVFKAALSGVLSPATLFFIFPDILELGLDLGGKSPIGLIANILQTFITEFTNFAGSVIGYQRANTAFARNIQTQVNDLISSVTTIARKTASTIVNVQLLSNVTLFLQKQIDALNNSINNRFSTVQEAFVVLANDTSSQVQVLLGLIQQQNEWISTVVTGMFQLDRKIDAVTGLIAGVSRFVDENRLVAKYYHQSLNESLEYQTSIGVLRPIANAIGPRPKTEDEIRNLENAENAFTMASVQLQGTVVRTSGAQQIAEAIAIDIKAKCSLKFIADLVQVARRGFLFENIGPNSPTTPSCSGVDGSARPWSCNCIIVVNSTVAQYSNSNPPSSILWPFAFSDYNGLLIDQYPTFSDTSVFPNGFTRKSTSYLSSIEQLQTFLNGPEVCNGRNWRTQRMRIVSQGTLQYNDVSMNPDAYSGGLTEMCNAEYRTTTGQSLFNVSNPAFTVYQLMDQEFIDQFPPRATYANSIIYGQGGETTVNILVGNPTSTIYNAYKTLQMNYAMLMVDAYGQTIQVPVYDAVLAQIKYYVQVQMDSNPPVLLESIDVDSTVTTPQSNPTFGNMTITTNIQLSNIFRADVAPTRFPLVGHPLQDPGTRYCVPLESDPNLCDMTQWLLFADYNFDELPLMLGARCGAKNYVHMSVDYWNSNLPPGSSPTLTSIPMNLSTILTQLQNDYDPTCAWNSLALNMRRIEPGTSYCGLQLDPATGTLQNPTPNMDMCNLRFYFDLPTFIPPTLEDFGFQMSPREWTTRFTLTVDDGTIDQLITTKCPEKWSATYINGTRSSTIKIENPAESISFRYSICKEGYKLCLRYGVLASAGPSSPLQFTLTSLSDDYFMQIWPWGDSNPNSATACFSGTGFSVGLNYSSLAVPGLPTGAGSRIITVVSSEMLSQASLIKVNTELQNILVKLQVGGISQSQFDALYKQAEELRNRIANLTVSVGEDPALQKVLQEAKASVLSLVDTVLNSTAQDLLDLAIVLQELEGIANRSVLGEELIQWMEFFTNRTIASRNKLLNDLQRIVDVPNFVDFVEDLIDAIPDPRDLAKKDFFDNLFDGIGFGGLGSFLGGAAKLLIWLLLIAVLGLCCCLCGPAVFKKFRDKNLSTSETLVADSTKEALSTLTERVVELERRDAEKTQLLESLMAQRQSPPRTKSRTKRVVQDQGQAVRTRSMPMNRLVPMEIEEPSLSLDDDTADTQRLWEEGDSKV